MSVSKSDQLPVALIARLVKDCIGIAEVMVRIQFKPEFFQSVIIKVVESCVYKYYDHFFITFT